MNADEIVKGLRAEAQFQKDRFSRFLLADAMFNAADLIGSLQTQLAASQRRERAAVKDVEKMMRICEKGSCHFCANGDCAESPYYSPKWRDPQDYG